MKNKNDIIAIERAIYDLRCGRSVIIEGKESSLLIMFAENIYEESLKYFRHLAKSNVYLAITGERSSIINNDESKSCRILLDDNISIDDIIRISGEVRGDISINTQLSSPLDNHAIKLAKLAEVIPSVIVADVGDIDDESLLIINAEQILEYENNISVSIEEASRAPLKLKYTDNAEIVIFRSFPGAVEHYAIIVGDNKNEVPLVRVHSSCYTGDLLSSLKCDCRDQLHEALHHMSENGGGILLYLMQEGRGIGLVNKIRAYALQADGMDTSEANKFLGFADDERPYGLAAMILKKLGINKIRMMTNNPRKLDGMEENGIKVTDRVPLITEVHDHNRDYLETKFGKLGHIGE